MAALQRYCLVTVGATVGFKKLTEQVLLPAFWQFLSSEGFTSLRIQCGPDISWATVLLDSHNADIPEGLRVGVFGATKNLMKDEMLLCRAESGLRSTGLVISHAGRSRFHLSKDIQSKQTNEPLLVLTIITHQEPGQFLMPGKSAFQ